MRFRLQREESREGVNGEAGTTFGKLYCGGVYVCETLEDDNRLLRGEEKVSGQTAIPAGTYQIVLSVSERFAQILPELCDVPQFQGVRVHSGNNSNDTEGCLLVGTTRNQTALQDSKSALKKVLRLCLEATKKNQEIKIEVVDPS